MSQADRFELMLCVIGAAIGALATFWAEDTARNFPGRILPKGPKFYAWANRAFLLVLGILVGVLFVTR